MSREIRRVPDGWEHPRYHEHDAPAPELVGRYRPQFEQTLAQMQAEEPDWIANDPSYYRPEHLDGGDSYQLYESTTEGTPLSPVFPSMAELVQHLTTVADDRGTIWPQVALDQMLKFGSLVTSEAVDLGV